MSEAAVRVEGASKSFGAFRALDDVSLSVSAGSIHAVLGENGAGKSTLMNLLSGFLEPDAGRITLLGQPLAVGDPRAVRRQGLAIVHQHFMLAPALSVAENLALDQLHGSRSVAEALRPAQEAADRLGWRLDLTARTGSLPVGAQQRIEILKALATGARVLILDEPTAVLTPDEIDDLFGVMRRLKSEGVAIILIAHKLAEVFAVADEFTVLRGGKLAGAARTADSSPAEAARWMVGESNDLPAFEAPAVGEPVLSAVDLHVRGDRGEPSVRGVSLEVRAGEVLGIGGVDGNGQIELAEALVGVRPASQGRVECDEPPAYIPQDRHRDGLVLSMPIWENTLLGAEDDDRLYAHGFLRRSAARRRAEEIRTRFDVRSQSIDQQARRLSGGNQQKVAVGRAIEREPRILVAVNPTRGLDLSAAQFVHRQLREAAERGAAVVVFSTDRDELAQIATRTAAMSAGQWEAAS
jgi:simple sugar transport system ATP-binding protein